MAQTETASHLDGERAALGYALAPAATTSERVRGLLDIGLHASELARVAGSVSVSAVRNWAADQAEPRPHAAIALDDLRAVAKILLDSGMEPRRIGHWLRGWNPLLENRPLDLIATVPMEVRRVAHAETLFAGTSAET
ncbi:hypothetical protein VSS74_25745 [Conexibacter stalactiti]|uniref:Transcriptional regulator n=1 Tax=Conexibacter stalactiti TaxID=1940611 RepID=A0ABU4HWT6_9ACTN|nr:hypothetical protein [Conexibacter stalactiti]MDW5597782.1 hypothetical protein [Conexibacter stalactiti]MEC5038424.1 hypothetical protein [Conexibacter stalactiti]